MDIKEDLKRSSSEGRRSKRKRHGAKEKFKKQKSVFQKLLESEHHMAMVFSYCGVFLLYGMTDELLGPTLIELSCLAAKPLKTMSWLFFSHDMGLLCGTLFGGLIVSRVDKNLAMTICLISNALSITILPILHKFMGMVIFVFLYGFFLGTPDTLANVMLIKVFGKEVAPYIQGVHFFYGFGAFLSPLVARPFLRKSCTYMINTTKYYDIPDPTFNLTYDSGTGLWAKSNTEFKRDEDSDIRYAYWMAALFHVPVIFGLSWIFLKRHLDSQKGIYRGSFVSLHNDDELPVQSLDMVSFNPEASFWERVQTNSKHRLLAVTILCSVIMYLYEGLMAMFGGYIYSYAVKGTVSMTSDQGAYLTSMYWVSILRALTIVRKLILVSEH
uniref:Uncharacterized protein n=1 Tax=Clytia hemisphaerica TaxID=252671 RepID=A0A7M5X365_9CNID